VAWRTPGYDAVFVATLTLVPIGLAVALDSSLLQVLVQLGTSADDQGPVLVVYATVTTIVTPLGGLMIGAVADELSLWGAVAVSGLVITLLAVCLRRRLRVFDALGPAEATPGVRHAHLHFLHFAGCDVPGALNDLFHVHHEPPRAEPAPALDPVGAGST
jgi:hypothetical protein